MSNLASAIDGANFQIQEVTPDVDRAHFWFLICLETSGFSLAI